MSKTTNSEPEEVKVMKAKCPDCDADLDVPADTAKGEILSGTCIDLQELTLEGEDWGE